jgi:hypothetical protein
MNGSYDPVREQLMDCYKREGKFVTVKATGNKNKVIFRRSQNKNTPKNHTTIFYFIDNTEIRKGSLLFFRDKYFLVLNQEEVENDNYYRSDIVQCNGVLGALLNKTQDASSTWYADELALPVFGDSMLSVSLNSSSVITTLGGSIAVITEDNEMSRLIQPDDEFDQWGKWGHRTVSNILFMNDLAYLWLERSVDDTLDPSTYKLTGVPKNDLTVNSIHNFTDIFQPIVSDSSTSRDYIIKNATLDIQSSDESIATIDYETRQITFHAEGNVELSCYWVEHNLSINIAIEVLGELPVAPNTCTIEVKYTSWTIPQDGTRRFVPHFFDGTGTELTGIVPTWELILPTALTGKITIKSQNTTNPNDITLAAHETSTSGTVFQLKMTANDATYGYFEAIADVKVVDLF